MEEKIAELVKATQDNAEKTQGLVSELEKERADGRNKDKIIRWLTIGIISISVCAMLVIGTCFFMHEYGYFFSPYIYGREINQNQTVGDAGVQITGGVN